MDKTLLVRSKKGLHTQVIVSGILALILVIFAYWIIGKLFSWTPGDGQFLQTLSLVFILGSWAISSLKLWSDWNIKKYEITDEAFIVHAKAGKWGSSQTIYRYESIISIKMTQGFWGKRNNYGDVRITIPKLDKDVVMNDIENPLEQLAEVQKRINDRSAGSHSLIN